MDDDFGLREVISNLDVVNISQHNRLLKVAFLEDQRVSRVADFIDDVTTKCIVLKEQYKCEKSDPYRDPNLEWADQNRCHNHEEQEKTRKNMTRS